MLERRHEGSLARYAAGAALLLPVGALARRMAVPRRRWRGLLKAMKRTLTATGEGHATASPDVAISQIGVQVFARTLDEASRQANDTMRKVLDVLKAEGIADRDIQTVTYSVNVERSADPRTGELQITGFRVVNRVQVKFRELGKVGETIDRAIAAGANDISNVTFAIEDPRDVEARARAAAMADVRTRAEQLARESGNRLGPAMQISELDTGAGGPRFLAAEVGPVPLQAGELDFVDRVQVVYGLY